MPDMLVKLYDLPDTTALEARVASNGIRIKRAISGDKRAIVEFVRQNFPESWANECEVAFSFLPARCFIAVKGKEIVGFACYEVVVRNYFGPTGVLPEHRGAGAGALLLTRALHAMRDDGYAYCIIGWAEEAVKFYERWANAVVIPDSFPGAYKDILAIE